MIGQKITSFDQIFRWQADLLEALFPPGWFGTPRAEHPAYRRWALCRVLHETGGRLPVDSPSETYQQVVSTLLDTVTLAKLSASDLDTLQVGTFQDYGDADFRRFRESRVQDANAFDDLMVELTYGAWLRLHGAEVTPIEEEGRADLRVCFAEPIGLLAVAECKRLTVHSENRVDALVKKASGQLRGTSQGAAGILVVDVTSALAGYVRESDCLVGDELEIFFRTALSGAKNRAVSAVVLYWDHYEHVPTGNVRVEGLLQRRWQTIRHESAEIALPESLQCFEGTTVYADAALVGPTSGRSDPDAPRV